MQIRVTGRSVWVALMAMAVLAAGCAKQKGPSADANSDDAVVVSVNGKVLTQAEVDKQVTIQMAAMRGRVSDEQLEAGRERLAFAAADQFVVKTLLLEQAERKGIEAPQAEVDAALERIAENLPAGKTLDDIVAQNPRGREGLVADVTDGMKINKLLEQELKEQLDVTDDEVAAFMTENAERLNRPDRVRARHILLKTEASDDDAAKAATKQELEDIRQKILDGADFAEMAKAHSACPSSKQGGDLGFFSRGRMAKAFEEAAFSQDMDAVGPVIETQFGYHIVQVTDKQAAGMATKEEVREMLKRRKQDTVVREYIQSLRAGADIVVKGKPLAEE